jgi:uncharacterized membrane protein (DUF4010 family)
MMEPVLSLQTLASAVGIGLLIGAVRERAESDPEQTVAGVRTFLVASLAGAVAAALGTAVLVATILVIGALVLASYLRYGAASPGLTGEVTLPLTALLAALAHAHPGLAAGIAVVMAIALYAKRPLHDFVRHRLSEQELRDGLLLAGAAVVVLPLLPDSAVDPWGVLVPSRLWRLVVLILAVGMAGHVALRVVGARWGLPVAGFFAGFASSTAAVAGFGQRVRADDGLQVGPAASGALFANLGSMSLFAAVIGAGAPQLLQQAALPLGAGAIALLLSALAGVRRRNSSAELPTGRRTGSAFSLWHALLLVGLLALLLLASAFLQQRFGSAGVLAAAAAVALVEIHAAAASLAQLAAQGQLAIPAAGWGLVLLMLVSGLAKAVLAWFSGGKHYGWRVGLGLMAVPVVMSLTMLLLAHSR